jgi:uncharacterized membrane protein YraQ (UPF0718 family)
MKERIKLLIIVLIFLACYFIPWSNSTIRQSGLEAFMMLQEYAREHVLACLIPAFFIAGAIAVFVSQASVPLTSLPSFSQHESWAGNWVWQGRLGLSFLQ